jgi:NADH dehydrogenase/NADH:ubiquinone oxidoreductase subunit G
VTVSKNPPLTEDQIRQSAKAEARHAAARASRHAQLDYMIAQQRQQQVAASLETIFGSEEDRFKAAASLIEDSAHRAIEEQDRQAREVGEEISQLVISSNSVGEQIAVGSIASGEALERLTGFREQHRRIAAGTQSIKAVYERQLEIAKDPGAAVDDLRRRFPALNL